METYKFFGKKKNNIKEKNRKRRAKHYENKKRPNLNLAEFV